MSDTDQVNGLLTTQAREVIAGVLRYPNAWPRVAGIVGEVLAAKTLRASAWVRTAWLALTEVFDANANIDALVLREKMQGLAQLKRPELLAEWTEDDDRELVAVVRDTDLVTSMGVVVDAAERLVTTQATHEFARGLATAQRDLSRDPLADPFAALSQLQLQLHATCRRASKVPIDNAAEQTVVALAVTRAVMLMTGFAWLDAEGGQDFGEVTLLGARTGVGKSTFVQAQARNQIFPDSAGPVRNVRDRLRVNTAPDRPYILVVSCENLKRMFFERLACDMLDIDSADMRRDRQEVLNCNNADPERVHSVDYTNALAQYGRLAVVDEDDLPNLSALAVTSAIEGWVDTVTAIDPDASMLVLLDYWQRTDPDDEHAHEQRTRQLELAAKRLKSLVRNRRIALTLAAQVNDTFDNAEPERGGIRDSRGGNNEAGNIWLMHTWSKAQRARIEECFTGVEARQRAQCVSLFSDKARSSAGGWRAVFNFDGAHYRITDAPAATANKDSRPINWLRDFDTLDAIKPDKKAKDAQQLTVGTTKAPKGPFG